MVGRSGPVRSDAVQDGGSGLLQGGDAGHLRGRVLPHRARQSDRYLLVGPLARGIALRVGADGLGDEYLDRLRVADPGQALVVLPGCCDLQRLVAGRLELVGAEVIAK